MKVLDYWAKSDGCPDQDDDDDGANGDEVCKVKHQEALGKKTLKCNL